MGRSNNKFPKTVYRIEENMVVPVDDSDRACRTQARLLNKLPPISTGAAIARFSSLSSRSNSEIRAHLRFCRRRRVRDWFTVKRVDEDA